MLQNGKCVNTEGDYYCLCNPHFIPSPDKKFCIGESFDNSHNHTKYMHQSCMFWAQGGSVYIPLGITKINKKLILQNLFQNYLVLKNKFFVVFQSFTD